MSMSPALVISVIGFSSLHALGAFSYVMKRMYFGFLEPMFLHHQFYHELLYGTSDLVQLSTSCQCRYGRPQMVDELSKLCWVWGCNGGQGSLHHDLGQLIGSWENFGGRWIVIWLGEIEQ